MVSKGAIIVIIIAIAGVITAAGLGLYLITHSYTYPHHTVQEKIITVGESQHGESSRRPVSHGHSVEKNHRLWPNYGNVLRELNIVYRDATESEIKLFNETETLVNETAQLKKFTIYIPIVKVILSGYGTSMTYIARNMIISVDEPHNMTYIETNINMNFIAEKMKVCIKVLHDGSFKICKEMIFMVGGRKAVSRSCNITRLPIYGSHYRTKFIKTIRELLRNLRYVKYYYIMINSTDYVCKCGTVNNMGEMYNVPIFPTYGSLSNLTLCLCLHPGMSYPEIMIARTYSGDVSVTIFVYLSKIEPYFKYVECESLMNGQR
ncbi:MAG: hypothetical protein GXO10_02210 [Crenarchaeota archaeon]|nr:hypothetical protein [Thermoproteota archaeon]